MTYAWTKRTQGQLTGVDWSDWLLRKDTCIDPYLVWADVTGAKGFAAHGEDAGFDRKWPFIIELSESRLPAQYFDDKPHGDVPWIFGVIDIPGVYKSEEPNEPRRWIVMGKYVTAHVHPCDVHHLLCSKHVKRAQLGLPRIRKVSPVAQSEPTGAASGLRERVVVGVIDDGFGFAHPKLLDERGMPRVRYLWDQDGRRENRLKGGWLVPNDLGYGAELVPKILEDVLRKNPVTDDDPWGPYRAVDYGRYRLDPYAHSSAPLDADGTPLPVESMLASSHGHSVIDLAAGFPPLHRGQTGPLPAALAPQAREAGVAEVDIRRAAADGKLAAYRGDLDAAVAKLDSADQWHLVCVQLPVRTVADTSGGSLAVHVLDGIRYIIERARRIPSVGREEPKDGDPEYRTFTKNPVIINVSYGALGGAHDGSSILEEAIERLNPPPSDGEGEAPAPVWVVLAAGNANRASAHASVDIVPGECKELVWRIGPDNPLESYLEIWLPDRDVNGHPVPAGMVERIAVDVRSPSGQHLVCATVGDVWQLCTEHGGPTESPIAALAYPRRVVQGKHGTMILLATAPTRAASGLCVAPHGEWTVNLNWTSQSAAEHPTLCIHAWTERNDLVFGEGREQQSRVFADEPVGELSESDPEARVALQAAMRNPALLRAPHGVRPQYGLSSLAGGPPARDQFALQKERQGEVVVVGAHRLVDCEASSASSGGPSRLTSRGQEVAALLSRGAAQRAEGAPERVRPDVSAPGDVSSAVAGLRTAGLRPASNARISATSAAAAQVTRAIANVQYAYTIDRSIDDLVEPLLFDKANPGASMERVERATLTSRTDDAFRRGPVRLR